MILTSFQMMRPYHTIMVLGGLSVVFITLLLFSGLCCCCLCCCRQQKRSGELVVTAGKEEGDLDATVGTLRRSVRFDRLHGDESTRISMFGDETVGRESEMSLGLTFEAPKTTPTPPPLGVLGIGGIPTPTPLLPMPTLGASIQVPPTVASVPTTPAVATVIPAAPPMPPMPAKTA